MIDIVSLNSAMDRTLLVKDFSVGQIYRSYQNSVVPGGKGLNVARFLKNLDESIPIRVIGFVGGDIGQYIVDECKKINIKEEFVKIKDVSRVCVIIVDNGQSTVINEDGPKITENELLKFWETANGHPELALISGSVTEGVPDQFYAELVRKYKQNSVPVFIDASGKQLENAVKEGPNLVKVNELEFTQLVHADHSLTISEIAKYAEELFTYGIESLIITLGSRGSMVLRPDNIAILHPPSVDAVNTVACGDAFFAGFVTGYYRGLNEVESAVYGTAASAIKAESFAPVIAHPEKIVDYCNRVITKYFSEFRGVN